MISHKLMLAFNGHTPPNYIIDWLRREPLGGFTIFRGLNVKTVAQVRELTAQLQRVSAEINPSPLLIATDQETGQFLALGHESTQFAGNMAVAATRNVALAEQIGRAIGLELAAVGINVNYAPNCDINTNPHNPACGIRAFGDEPALVATMTAATVRGLQAAGVAATAKHFPGIGEAQQDSHYRMPLIEHNRERLDAVELVPFKAAFKAGAKMAMTGHFAIPALTGSVDVPATLAHAVMHDLLRTELGFDGVTITDAFDMQAIEQGTGQLIDAIAAFRADVDLLLLTEDKAVQERLAAGLQLALSRRLLHEDALLVSAERIQQLKQWVAQFPQPDLSIVNCHAHQQLANQLAQESITLVRNHANALPLQLEADATMAVIMPQPENLTPADTSAFVQPQLAQAIQQYHTNVKSFVVPHTPTDDDIAAVLTQVDSAEIILVGTISASMNPAQATLVNQLLKLEKRVVTVALRTPYDLTVYPTSQTHLCTYSILRPSLAALAAVLFGKAHPTGKLPVTVAGLYPVGHGLAC